ncbi:MAG TPA: 6,7-dimethyl-8-ribityllumazine synthase [Gemmatimonadales bacterium]|nr:6,7-dimethyl-8-ribityllumazine synthase [Gemmatimonadales bacterium]
MTDIEGRLRSSGRIALVVSRYNELITTKLLEGARACCTAAGAAPGDVDVVWVPGAFELGVVAMTAARSGRYSCIVALGAVIRGETPHFNFVAGEASRALASVALETGRPVGFGLLTTDDLDQALARAGGVAGNKGYEAADAAIRAADALRQLGGGS